MQSVLKTKKLTCASFYSGGGLFDYGFMQDFEIIWANEINPSAAACYVHNIGSHIQIGNIEAIHPRWIPEVDLYIGGPPCIDYTTNGKGKGESGDTGGLIWDYQQKIRYNLPKAFVFENVIGMKNRHSTTFERMILGYENCGYKISTKVMNAADYGVAQDRKRVFVVGIRNDMGFQFVFPEGVQNNKTVREAIGDLPAPTCADEPEKIPNHVATWTSPDPERIIDVMANPRKQWRGMRRLLWDEKSPAIVAHIAKDGREHLHPCENRKLTVREFLRIMGVDDSFVIPPSVKLTQQYRMTGNGVAVPVAKALAQALRVQLENAIESNLMNAV